MIFPKKFYIKSMSQNIIKKSQLITKNSKIIKKQLKIGLKIPKNIKILEEI